MKKKDNRDKKNNKKFINTRKKGRFMAHRNNIQIN
jgi:hypothetical protein